MSFNTDYEPGSLRRDYGPVTNPQLETAYQHGFRDAVAGKLTPGPYEHPKLADAYDRGYDAAITVTEPLSPEGVRCFRDMLKYDGYHGQAATRETRMELVDAGVARIIDGGFTNDLRITLTR